MRQLLTLGVAFLVIQQCFAPPVVVTKETEELEAVQKTEYNLEYERYLHEVVQALESDLVFKKKLENSTNEYIKEGKIADELEFVNHNVRTRLNELKRIELEKLKELAKLQSDENSSHPIYGKIPEHLDHTNKHTFEAEDLKRLILKVTADMADYDKKRRDSFKEYEMDKKYQQEEKMKEMDEQHRKEYEKELNMTAKKLKEHKPMHHPGSKQQLEEVWEEQDHMDRDSFDPRAFFFMHDLDGNHAWDETEVKALFLKELDKMYNEGAQENDLRERAEDLERMREHVFKEADIDQNNLISFKEFMDQTKKPDFNTDEGWDTVHDTPAYTEDDYRIYAAKRNAEHQNMIANHIPAHEYDTNEIGHGEQYPPQYGNVPVNNAIPPYQQQQQQYHGQVPPQQQYQGQVPPQQHYQGQVPLQQQYQGQVPPQQQYHGQVPLQQQYQGQVPLQQQYQGQVPHQQQFNGQAPPQHIQYQGQQQIPQYQQAPPQQQQYAQDPVQQQHIQQHQVPVQQQAAVPVQQHPAVPVQQQAAVPVQQQAAAAAAAPVQQQAAQQQVPAQQQAAQHQVPAQQQAAQQQVPAQQNIQGQANVQGQVPMQQQQVPAINNQVQQQAGHNGVAAQQPVAGNSHPAREPSVVLVN